MNMHKALIVSVAAIAAASVASACTGVYVGKKVSEDGSVLLCRTVDSSPWTSCHRISVAPRVENAPGRIFTGKRGCRWELPETTWKVVSTPMLKSIGRGCYASACVNERGLAVTGTVTGKPGEIVDELDPFVEKGFAEESLPGLLALCCSTAREAVELLGKAVADQGHWGAEIYMFADNEEAWYVEVYSGHQWAAVRMPDDKVACFGNQMMIQSFDPSSPDTLSSPSLVSLPEKAGKLVRGADGLPDLRATYAHPIVDYGNLRTWFGHREFAPSTAGKYSSSRPMPLFFVPDRKIGRQDVFELFRSRFEGSGWCPEETGDLTIRVIGTTKQATCHVIALDPSLPAMRRCTIWATFANSEHSVFLPVNAAVTDVAKSFALDQEGEFHFDQGIPGMAFRRLCALSEQNRRWYGAGVRSFWRDRETRLLADFPKVLASGSAAELTSFCSSAQTEAYNDALRIFDDLMWYVAANNRIEGDGSGATSQPPAPFSVATPRR